MSEFVLVAKFLTKCVLNVEAIGWTFKPFWKSWREFKVRDVGNHIVLFVFDSKIDAQRVLMNVPWSFDKNLVLFSQLENNSAIRNINFTHSLFWIQLHGLPVKKLNVDTVEIVGTIVSSHFKNDMIGEILCLLEFELMFQNLFVGVVELYLKMVKKDGLRLDMRNFLISIIGVAL